MENKLLKVNRMIADSLQFAEAKNAALITFNGAALYLFSGGLHAMPAVVSQFSHVFSSLLVLGISVSLIAFLPIMNPKPMATKRERKKRKEIKEVSIFYFGHIRLFDPDKLLLTFYDFYGKKVPESFLKSELDLARQTIVIARITWRKYIFFTIAGNLTLISLLVPIPFLIIYWSTVLYKRLRT